MYLLNYIKTHPNWEQELSKKPYCLKITHDDIYTMFKYNQIESDFSYPIVQECRGVIIKFIDNEPIVVCRPFDKFFNYGEPNVAKLDWSMPVAATTKIDGSLIKLWCDRGIWHISTNGTIDAFDAEANNAMGLSFGDLFLEALRKNNLTIGQLVNRMEEDATYMFELISPYNRIVIPYQDTDLYYLGARLNKTGEYIGSSVCAIVKTPELQWITDIDELIPQVEAMDWQHEGFVLFDGINRIKLKSPAYVLAHYARANGNINKKHLIKVILEGEENEFLTYAEEYKDALYKIKYKMNILRLAAKSLYLESITFATKKELANYLKEVSQPLAGYAFKAYDNLPKYLDWKDYTTNWTPEKWEKYL